MGVRSQRDLDDEAERYIVGWAREIEGAGPLRLIVTLPAAARDAAAAQRIPDAVHNYFSYRAGRTRQDLRELLRIGWHSLAIGLVVLLPCFVAIQNMKLSERASCGNAGRSPGSAQFRCMKNGPAGFR